MKDHLRDVVYAADIIKAVTISLNFNGFDERRAYDENEANLRSLFCLKRPPIALTPMGSKLLPDWRNTLMAPASSVN